MLDLSPSPLIGVVSLDIRKAFDNINHELLINKLKYLFNFSPSAIKWFSNFLSNRIYITKVNNVFSHPIIKNRGIPQGSVLSPILFNLFINDLTSIDYENNLSLYADDFLFYCIGSSPCDVSDNLSQKLTPFLDWYSSNDLEINMKKTKFLLLDTSFRFRNPVPLKLNKDLIFPSNTLNYLGCILDNHLNFSPFIDNLCQRASHRIYFLKLILRYIKPAASSYYNYFIRPLLETYPSILISASTTNSHKLELVQNRALKIISGIKFNKKENTTLSIIRHNLNIPLLYSRRLMLFLNKIFKVIHNLDPILTNSLKQLAPPNHRFPLRTRLPCSNSISIPKYNKPSFGDKCFDALAALHWNVLPDDLKDCQTLNKFKSLTKLFFLDF